MTREWPAREWPALFHTIQCIEIVRHQNQTKKYELNGQYKMLINTRIMHEGKSRLIDKQNNLQ